MVNFENNFHINQIVFIINFEYPHQINVVLSLLTTNTLIILMFSLLALHILTTSVWCFHRQIRSCSPH